MEVHGRTPADETVAFATKTTPAAIVIDVRVPADCQLCGRFQREPATIGVPVVAISGLCGGRPALPPGSPRIIGAVSTPNSKPKTRTMFDKPRIPSLIPACRLMSLASGA